MNTAAAFISVCVRYECVLLGNNNPLSPICLPAFCLLKDSIAIFYLTATTQTRRVQTARASCMCDDVFGLNMQSNG